MAGNERPACRAAIVQALRFVFGLRVKEIAVLMKIGTKYVSQVTGDGIATVLSWEERSLRKEAIEAAGKILKSST